MFVRRQPRLPRFAIFLCACGMHMPAKNHGPQCCPQGHRRAQIYPLCASPTLDSSIALPLELGPLSLSLPLSLPSAEHDGRSVLPQRENRQNAPRPHEAYTPTHTPPRHRTAFSKMSRLFEPDKTGQRISTGQPATSSAVNSRPSNTHTHANAQTPTN